MKKPLPILLITLGSLFAAIPIAVATEPLERDLGHGLAYRRVHSLPEDLTATLSTPPHGAVVLDLRYVHAEPGSTTVLADWLKSHSATAAPVFVLLNPKTDSAVLRWFAGHDAIAGLVTIGGGSASFTPDIVLKIHPSAERAAYESLEHGGSIDSLLTETIAKPRHDEASIAQERAAVADESAQSDDDIASPGEAVPVKAVPPRSMVDYTLLRAVQLHRALLALKKL